MSSSRMVIWYIVWLVLSFLIAIGLSVAYDSFINTKYDPVELVRVNDSLYVDSVNSINLRVDSLIKSRDRYLSIILSDSIKKSVSETSINTQDSLFKSYGYSMDRNKKLVKDTLKTSEGHLIILTHYNNQCICSYIKTYELELNESEVTYIYEEETVPLKKNVNNSATFLEE